MEINTKINDEDYFYYKHYTKEKCQSPESGCSGLFETFVIDSVNQRPKQKKQRSNDDPDQYGINPISGVKNKADESSKYDKGGMGNIDNVK